MNRAAWATSTLAAAVLFDRPINRHRRSLSLPTVRAASIRLPLRAESVLVHVDPTVVDVPPDWPGHVHVTGEITWDRASSVPVEPALIEFLASGAPPVLITLGSSNAVLADDFFDLACRAVRANGHRALVVTGPATWVPPESPDVFVTDFAPFSAIASKCAAAIHHAGAGTTKAFVRAGIPQLAVPRAFDQPDTARELIRLGVAIQVPWNERHAQLAPALAPLLQSEKLRDRAAHVATTLHDDGASRAADAVEDHL